MCYIMDQDNGDICKHRGSDGDTHTHTRALLLAAAAAAAAAQQHRTLVGVVELILTTHLIPERLGH